MLIECQSCVMQHSDHCKDCVVTAVIDPDPRLRVLDVDDDEVQALRELAAVGLIPEIRMRPRRTA